MNTNAFYERLFRQNERVMKFGLDAIQGALAREPGIVSYPHILIAGTNGKGQTSALFANALTLAGIRTGLFTSPHLVRFSERIRVDGACLDEDEIVEIGTQVLSEYGGETESDASGITLTYFECCLMMALRAFKRSNVSYGVFEVGLGGRLDATNALNPAMSIITSISRDHEAYLGNDTAGIAREKAGIMRAGCPVICGRTEVDVLRSEANARGCSSFEALGHDFDWHRSGNTVYLESKFGNIELPGAEHLADYQCDNASVAIFALLRAEELGVIPGIGVREIIKKLIPGTRWVGRMWPCSLESAQKWNVGKIVMDGAHNPDGVRVFVQAIQKDRVPHSLVVNSCGDKAVEAMFPQYLKTFERDSIFVVPIETTKRACDPSEYCVRVGLDAKQACQSLKQGLERAAQKVGMQGIVYVSGSLYLIGEALVLLDELGALSSTLIDA